MGAFNTVKAHVQCPCCSEHVQIGVQFKYGDTRQHEYELGDMIRWGGNDIGVPRRRAVVIDGVADSPCPTCGHDSEWNFYVFVNDDRIVRVAPANGTHDFATAGHTYIELE